MIRLAFPSGARALLGILAVLIGVAVVVPAARGGMRSSASIAKLAARVMRRDPGKEVGGNTQVATAAGRRLLGVPDRVNFMMALGPREVIVGGAGHDEVGALGDAAQIYAGGGPDLIHGGPGNDRLHGGPGNDLFYGGGGNDIIDGGPGNDGIYGGPGNDVIYGRRGNDVIDGGPGNDVIYGGPGNDRITDHQGATTLFPGPGTNQVDVADGQADDRVRCTPGSINHIKADRGDQIAPSCRGKGSSVHYVRLPSGHPAAHSAQLTVSGDGSNANPYTAPCDNPGLVDCTVSSFAARSLSGWLTNEHVPAYDCPSDHPFLYRLHGPYNPFGTTVPLGVEIEGLGPVGVSITGFKIGPASDGHNYTEGTLTGGFNSSATNWGGGTQSYKVILHCTSDFNHGVIQF